MPLSAETYRVKVCNVLEYITTISVKYEGTHVHFTNLSLWHFARVNVHVSRNWIQGLFCCWGFVIVVDVCLEFLTNQENGEHSRNAQRVRSARARAHTHTPVSYTHLTLPTMAVV